MPVLYVVCGVCVRNLNASFLVRPRPPLQNKKEGRDSAAFWGGREGTPKKQQQHQKLLHLPVAGAIRGGGGGRGDST